MIVFFLPNLQVGGAERVMVNLLITYHHKYPASEILLLLGEKRGGFLDEIPNTIPIHILNKKRGLTAILPFIKFCKNFKPNIVFSTLGSSVTTSLAKPFISKSITIVNRVGNTIGAEKYLYTNLFKRRGYIFANQLIAKYSDHLIFQCEYMAKDYINETKVVPISYSVIYNPVKVEHISKKAEENISQSSNLIAVGRLQAQKDYSTLLKACAHLKSNNILFNLAILGEGELRKNLEIEIENLEISKEVKLMGYVKNPYPYIKNADYLVSSSLFEGFSNVIIEALCLGTPVISTDCPGGNAETLEKDFNGYLCKVGDAEDMAEIINKALNERDSLNSDLIAEKAKERYAEDVIFKAYDNILSKNSK